MNPKRAAVFGCLLILSLGLSGCGGHSSSSTATVVTVTIAPTTASVAVNHAQSFGATAVDSTGSTISTVSFVWSSSAPNVATIGGNGVALGLSAGTTQITAATSGVTSAPATLNVTQPIASILVAPATAAINVNATQQFTATALDVGGNPVSGAVFAWFSSFAGTATIDSNGLATGVAPGTVTIVASAAGVNSAPVTLTVNP